MSDDNVTPLRATSSPAINEFDKIVSLARSEARYVVTLDRDEEKYELKVMTYPKLEASNFPARSQIYKMIPSGSSWQYFKAWRSYFAIPFEAIDEYGTKDWIFFGCEEVATPEHGSERGPSPILRAYCIHQSKTAFALIADTLDKLNQFLTGNTNRKDFELYEEDIPLFQRGFIKALSKNVDEHIPIERFILKDASKHYRQHQPFLFRTLLISENQKPNKNDQPFLVAFREDSKININKSFTDVVSQTFKDWLKRM